MNFDFLKTVELSVPERKVTAIKSVSKTPEGGLFLRVFGSGKIYPSKELTEKFNLEYTDKDSEIESYGLDVFKSSEWPMFPSDAPGHFIFVAVVKKGSPKLDLFNQVGYDETGAPKNSVLTQGGGSFGSALLEMLESVYGITIEKGEYKDFLIKEDVQVKSPNDVYYIPKTVSRGEDKGKADVVRRESIIVMPLVPIVDVEIDVQEKGDIDFEEVDSIVDEVVAEEAPSFLADIPFGVPTSGDESGYPNRPLFD